MTTCIIYFAARGIFGVELVDIVSFTTVEFVFTPATIEDVVMFCTLEFVVFVVPGFDLTYLREDVFSFEVIYYFDETFSFFAFLIEGSF